MKLGERKFIETAEPDLQDRWIVPYADLVTLLLALFIVLYAAADKQKAAQIASSFRENATASASGDGILDGNRAEKTKDTAASILSDPVLIKHSKMIQANREVTVSLAEAAVFAPGESDVTADADETISALASKLKTSKGRVRIEGHTDSTPISNGRFRSNWELSTARASSVLVQLMKNGIEPARLSAAGYGGFRPVADNSTPEGRSLNRRVDVVIELGRDIAGRQTNVLIPHTPKK